MKLQDVAIIFLFFLIVLSFIFSIDAPEAAAEEIIYCELWNYSGPASPYQTHIEEANTYYNLSGLVLGNCNGFNFTDYNATMGGNYLTSLSDSLYKVSLSMSFRSGANGGLYGISVTQNYNVSKNRECYARRAANTLVGNVGITCLLDITKLDKINIQIENENTDRDIYIHTLNLNLRKIKD